MINNPLNSVASGSYCRNVDRDRERNKEKRGQTKKKVSFEDDI